MNYDVEIPLVLNAKQAGNFSISNTEMTNFEHGTRIILKDKLNPELEFEFSEGIAYNFISQVGSGSDRFSLVFRAPGTTTEAVNTQNSNVQIFVNAANQIVIIAPEKSNYAILQCIRTTGCRRQNNFKLSNLKPQTKQWRLCGKSK